MTTSTSDDRAPTLDELREVARNLETLDEARRALINDRDNLIRALRKTTSGPVIGKATGLTPTGIYKIVRNSDHQ